MDTKSNMDLKSGEVAIREGLYTLPFEPGGLPHLIGGRCKPELFILS